MEETCSFWVGKRQILELEYDNLVTLGWRHLVLPERKRETRNTRKSNGTDAFDNKG